MSLKSSRSPMRSARQILTGRCEAKPLVQPPVSSRLALYSLAWLFFDAAGWGVRCTCCPSRAIPKA